MGLNSFISYPVICLDFFSRTGLTTYETFICFLKQEKNSFHCQSYISFKAFELKKKSAVLSPCQVSHLISQGQSQTLDFWFISEAIFFFLAPKEELFRHISILKTQMDFLHLFSR